MTTLGCGKWEAYAQTRGRDDVLALLPYETLRCGRRLDNISDANLEIGAGGLTDERCCRTLRDLASWEHELALRRDGEVAWVGPVGDAIFSRDRVRLPARDLFTWFERRLLPFDRSFEDTDLADVFATYADDALSRDRSPNIAVVVHPTDVFGSRTVKATSFRRSADELRELSRDGVDWTMIGRTLRGGGREIPDAPVLGPWTNEYLLDPQLVVRGTSATSEVTVFGSSSGEVNAPFFGVAGGIDPRIGLVQTSYSEPSIEDASSAQFAAETRLALFGVVPEFVTGRLSSETPAAFGDLIPGTPVELRVDIGCRRAIGTWRLHAVNVDASAEDESEVIDVELAPLGSVD